MSGSERPTERIMKVTEKSITQAKFAYLFFFIALEPAAFRHFSIVSDLFTIAQCVMFLLVLALWMPRDLGFFIPRRRFTGKNNGRSVICVLLAVYYVFFVVNAYVQDGRPKSTMFQGIQFLGFIMYLDLVLTHNPKELFGSALNILTFYLVVNFGMVLLLPGGLYETIYYANNYLLGYDNQNINFILPALVLVLLKNACLKPCKGQVVFTYLVAMATAVKIWSGMTMVVVGIMSAFAALCLSEKKFLKKSVLTDKIFNFFTLLITNIVMFILLVFCRIQVYFESFITGVLKKSMTLSNRTIIWDRVIEWIKKSPIVGYGKEDYYLHAIKLGFKENSPAGLHAHNRFLETMYCGGIVLTSIYLAILFYTARCLSAYRKTLFAKILSFGIFVYMVGMLTEFYDYCIFFWGFMVIAEHCYTLEGMKNGSIQ